MSLNKTTTADLYIRRFENVSHSISNYIFIFYLIIGNIGNIFKTLFFLQKPLKSCPCSIYVIVATISHFFTLNNIPILNLLSNDWVIVGFEQSSSFINETVLQNSFVHSSSSIKMCQIRIYFHMWSTHFSFQVLVFASINRFCMCLKKKNREQKQRMSNFFCSLISAYIICSITCIMWALISLYYLFNFTIRNNVCAPKNVIVWGRKLASIYFFHSLLIIIFGTLTILYRQKHVIFVRRPCRNHHEMIPMFNQLCQYCRNERSERHHIEVQLTSMIITEIILVVLSTLPYAAYIVYRLITIEMKRSLIQMSYENIIERLIRLTMFFEPSCGFYIYLFTLKSLKTRFFYIVRRKLGIF